MKSVKLWALDEEAKTRLARMELRGKLTVLSLNRGWGGEYWITVVEDDERERPQEPNDA